MYKNTENLDSNLIKIENLYKNIFYGGIRVWIKRIRKRKVWYNERLKNRLNSFIISLLLELKSYP